MESTGKKIRTGTPVQSLGNASKDVLGEIFKHLTVSDLCTVQRLCKKQIHQAATKALEKLKTRQFRLLFPDLLKGFGKKVIDLKYLKIIRDSRGSGLNARQRYEAVKGTENLDQGLLEAFEKLSTAEASSQDVIQYAKSRDTYASIEESKPPDAAWIDAADDEGHTALYHAIDRCDRNLIKWLLTYGANVHATDSKGCTPLHRAVQLEEFRLEGPEEQTVVEILLEHGANIEAVDNNGLTPLHHAVIGSSEEMTIHVETLLQHGANIKAVTDGGSTALDLAKEYQWPNVEKILLT